MFMHPAVRKVIDASKLPNFNKEKFSLPVKPVVPKRYIRLRRTPTEQVLDSKLLGTVVSFNPGHIDLQLSHADMILARTDFDPGLKDHPKLSDVLARLGVSAQLTMGHAPDQKAMIQRAYRVMGSMGVEYNNIEYKAQPWYADYFAQKNKDLKSHDLGNLKAAHLSLLYKICREQWHMDYSLGGQDKPPPDNLWTQEEFINYLATGIAPSGKDNCVDFIKRCLTALARYEAPDSPGLQSFLYQLGFARQPQDVWELAAAHFKPDEQGFLSFAAPLPQPRKSEATRELTQEEEYWAMMLESEEPVDTLQAFKKSANYAAFSKAFGAHTDVFDAIAAGLHRDNSFFDAVFSSADEHNWGVTFFTKLGEMLARCTGSQGVAVVLYFKNTYPGGISHVATVGFSRNGKVSISHHESIALVDKPGMQDGLAIGTVGVPSASFNTVALHDRLQNRQMDKRMALKDLPILKSFADSGAPTGTFTLLDDYDAFEAFNLHVAAQGQGVFGKQWLYGVDPNQKLAELAAAIKSGKVKIPPLKLAMLRCDLAVALHPKLPPPGATGDFVPGLYTNNCARLTLLALLAGRAPALGGVKYCESMDLTDVAIILFKAGLMPNTDPNTLKLMREVSFFYNKNTHAIDRHTAEFLALGQLLGWANALPGTPGAYAASVERRATKDPEGEAKIRQACATRLADAIKKNQQSFLDLLGEKPQAPTLPWVVRELTVAKDKALIDAHLAGLSENDLYWRFGISNAKAAFTKLETGPDQGHFGVFDPTGKTMVGLGLYTYFIEGDTPAVEVGFSVLPASRKKGVAKAGMQWAMSRARNRGMLRMVAQYYMENTASKQLLKTMGTPEVKQTYAGTEIVEMALPVADGASHLLEATHQHISSGWAPHK